MAQAEAVQTRRQQELEAVRRQPGTSTGLHQGVPKESTVSTRLERWPLASLAAFTSEAQGPNSLPRRFAAVFASLMPHRILRVTISQIILLCTPHIWQLPFVTRLLHGALSLCTNICVASKRNDDGTVASGGNSPILVNETWTVRIYAEDSVRIVPR